MFWLRFISIIASDVRKSRSLITCTGCRVLLLKVLGQNSTATKLPEASWFTKRTLHSTCFLYKDLPAGNKPVAATIQVLGINGEPRGHMTLQKAERLAKGEQLKLLKVEDDANSPPVYRLVTAREFNSEERRLKALKKAEKQKPLKTLKLSNTITGHDLEIKLKNISSWLETDHEVKITIKSGSSVEGENQIFDQIAKHCKELGKVQNAKKTETELTFLLQPKTDSLTSSENISSDQKQKPLTLDELKQMQSVEEKEETIDRKHRLKDSGETN